MGDVMKNTGTWQSITCPVCKQLRGARSKVSHEECNKKLIAATKTRSHLRRRKGYADEATIAAITKE